MRSVVLFIFLAFSKIGSAQEVKFEYDAVGNRVLRKDITVIGARMAFGESRDSKKDDLEDKAASKVAKQYKINLTPNPTKDFVNLSVENFDASNSTVAYILDLNGKIISQQNLTTGNTKLDFQEVPPGIYVVQIIIEESKLYFKVVKS